MNDMRIYEIMNDMRIIKLWMVWEYKNYEWYENNEIMNGMRIIELWMIWEYIYLWNIYIYKY